MENCVFKKGVSIAIYNGNLSDDEFSKVMDCIFNELVKMGSESDKLNYIPLQADDHIIITSLKNDLTIEAFDRIKKSIDFCKSGYLEVHSVVNDDLVYVYKMEFLENEIKFKFIGGK